MRRRRGSHSGTELETVTTPQAKYWTSKQAGRFLDAIVDDPLYALYHLTLHRGPRRGEILALRWEDVDLEARTIDIRRNLVQIGYATVEGTPKSEASQRLVTVDKSTAKALKRHRKQQRRQRAALGLEPDGELVFTTEDVRQLHPEYASRHLDVLIRKAGVPRITFHQLRHTAAALMLEAGADLKYVQYVLGHEDMFITARIYAHVTARLDRLRAAQIEANIPRKRKLSGHHPNDGGALAVA